MISTISPSRGHVASAFGPTHLVALGGHNVDDYPWLAIEPENATADQLAGAANDDPVDAITHGSLPFSATRSARPSPVTSPIWSAS